MLGYLPRNVGEISDDDVEGGFRADLVYTIRKPNAIVDEGSRIRLRVDEAR